ncbi:DUF4292 domain-containing protein [Flavobacterium agricola]|uniref:DUF4292 domain-containing protein n=1 Tax=Flavobacterium agricola TaxID=2870839 RepID=A0ABY6LXC9_9FLAO|nr:DUF4292 domain-containing protein [Flavobacterium agricola]UYW00884.1 DUF4292 domain-containing protein [Flavobacterium agricola]
MMIKKFAYLFCSLFILTACSSKKTAVETAEATSRISKSELATKHYAIPTDFNTLNIRTAIKFKDKKLDQSASADIRIEKDKQILVVVRFLGITFVKALITPDRVSYYDSFNGQYFDGNYQILSNWLGVDLDYTKVQNIFLGKSIYDLNQVNFVTALDNGLHKIKYKTRDGVINESFFEDLNYLLLKTTLKQPDENRQVVLNYTDYKATQGIFLPATIAIVAEQENPVQIDIKYNSVSVNDNVSFKYEIPNGFKQIQLVTE